MSEQQMRDLLASAVTSPGPDTLDVDAMVRGGRRRRRRRALSAVGAVTVLVVLVGAVLWAFPRQGGPGPASPGAGQRLALPTSSWAGGAGRAALLEGTLVLTRDGCLITGTGAEATAIVWPAGYTAERAGSSAVIRDSAGEIVARSGQKVSLGGGFGLPGSGPCIDGYEGPFYVEAEPPFISDPTATSG